MTIWVVFVPMKMNMKTAVQTVAQVILFVMKMTGVNHFFLVDCTWSAWSSWSSCSATCGGGYEWRNRTVTQEALNGGIECENCTDSSTTGNCNLITTLAIYDNSTVENSCARGDQNGLGALFCEKTCDDNLGGFCPNENDYRNCSTNGCPGMT